MYGGATVMRDGTSLIHDGTYVMHNETEMGSGAFSKKTEDFTSSLIRRQITYRSIQQNFVDYYKLILFKKRQNYLLALFSFTVVLL